MPKITEVTGSYKVKANTFRDEPKQFFDLAAIKCNFISFESDKFQRAPVQQEQLFLTDQWLDNKQYLNDQLDYMIRWV